MKTKIAFAFLSLLVLFTIYYLLSVPIAYAAGATFSLSPASGSHNIGSVFSVNVILNTGSNETSGADAILIYEPAKLSAQSITAGAIYDSYPIKTINATAGKILISGITSNASSSFSGNGTFATIAFKPLVSGTSTLRFDFKANEPTDSNVAKKGTQGEDILTSVSNATYTITSGSVTPTPGAGGAPPVSGVFEVTLAITLVGLGLFTSGFFLFRKNSLVA